MYVPAGGVPRRVDEATVGRRQAKLACRRKPDHRLRFQPQNQGRLADQSGTLPPLHNTAARFPGKPGNQPPAVTMTHPRDARDSSCGVTRDSGPTPFATPLLPDSQLDVPVSRPNGKPVGVCDVRIHMVALSLVFFATSFGGGTVDDFAQSLADSMDKNAVVVTSKPTTLAKFSYDSSSADNLATTVRKATGLVMAPGAEPYFSDKEYVGEHFQVLGPGFSAQLPPKANFRRMRLRAAK